MNKRCSGNSKPRPKISLLLVFQPPCYEKPKTHAKGLWRRPGALRRPPKLRPRPTAATGGHTREPPWTSQLSRVARDVQPQPASRAAGPALPAQPTCRIMRTAKCCCVKSLSLGDGLLRNKMHGNCASVQDSAVSYPSTWGAKYKKIRISI